MQYFPPIKYPWNTPEFFTSSSGVKTEAIPLALNETHSSTSAQLELCLLLKGFVLLVESFLPLKSLFYHLPQLHCDVWCGHKAEELLPAPSLAFFSHSSCRDGGSWQQAKPSWQVSSLLTLPPSSCDASLSSTRCWKSLWATWRWNIYYLLVTQGTVSVFIGPLPVKPNIPSVGSSVIYPWERLNSSSETPKCYFSFRNVLSFPWEP